MNDIINNKTIKILTNLIELFESVGEHDLARSFNKTKQTFIIADDKKEIAREILQLYNGGMGSFQDVVLQKDDKMLKIENIELEKYKELLFQSCKNLL